MGFALDSALFAQSWAVVEVGCATAPRPWWFLDPPWMVSLWLAFAVFADLCLPLFAGRVLLCAVLGAVFGPLAYAVGQAIGSLRFEDGALKLIALEYAVGFPLVVEGAAWSARLSIPPGYVALK